MLCLMFVGLTILKGLVHVFNTLQRLFPFNDDMIGFDRLWMLSNVGIVVCCLSVSSDFLGDQPMIGRVRFVRELTSKKSV